MTQSSTTWSGRLPTFSIIMPVHDPNLRDFVRAVESVRRQIWPTVELCLVDDASKDPEIVRSLDGLGKEAGIHLHRLATNQGIAAATNAAIELASGDFLVFVDHDDELTENALCNVAAVLRERPELDFVYSDHDVIDEEGRRRQVCYKPDWSPELLLAYMYVGHLKVVRTSLARALGGLRAGFEGAADYDFMLRLAEQTDRIHHIPDVLYHWRAAANSIARHADTKTHAFESGRRAVADALARRRIPAVAEWPAWAQRIRTGVYWTRFGGGSMGRVTILIPTRDRVDLLCACITSIEERTDYDDWEIIILDNDSREAETCAYLAETPHRVVPVPGPFNFSKIVNRGVEASESEFVLLLNNDTIIVSRTWLTELVGACRLPGVGAVGAKLLYADGRIQHAGVTMGVHGLTGHAFEGRLDRYTPVETGFFAHVPRNVTAVTAACMLTRRQTYLDVGGFDEEELAVAWNDTDFCLRLGAHGWRVVMNPLAEVIHLGSSSRGEDKNDHEIAVMFKRWSEQIERDPYSNPNWSRLENDFRPRTLLDERPFFHYSPAGFNPAPGEGPVAHDQLLVTDAVLGEVPTASVREICLNQAELLRSLSIELARFEQLTRWHRALATSPLFARLYASTRFRRLARRARDSARVRRWLRRIGVAS
jgi:GT2 family glycosyltransferase